MSFQPEAQLAAKPDIAQEVVAKPRMRLAGRDLPLADLRIAAIDAYIQERQTNTSTNRMMVIDNSSSGGSSISVSRGDKKRRGIGEMPRRGFIP